MLYIIQVIHILMSLQKKSREEIALSKIYYERYKKTLLEEVENLFSDD